jgi:hypothetical protein
MTWFPTTAGDVKIRVPSFLGSGGFAGLPV